MTKAREEDKIRALRDAGFDMDLGGADITERAIPERQQLGPRQRRVHARGRGRHQVRPPGPQDQRAHPGGRRPRAVPQDQPGRVGVRRPGAAVRRHDQRLAHQPRDRPDHGVQPVLGIHVARQLVVQPRVAEPPEVPPRRRHLRRRAVRPGGRADHHRDGHLDLLRGLPDRGDRQDHRRLPPARHRLRQPRRPADGDGPRLRQRRRPRDGGGADLADDRYVVPPFRRARLGRRPLRRLRPQRRRPPARDAQAPGCQRHGPHPRDRGRAGPQAGHQGVGRRSSSSARPTASATPRPRCSPRPGPSAS